MTQMIEVKTAELEFGALDWCVALILGLQVEMTPPNYGNGTSLVFISGSEDLYRPSVDWSHGGPIIGNWMVSLHCPQTTDDVWAAWVITNKGEFCQAGDTPLAAACRAIVASKLGDTVQIPVELMS